MPTPEDKQTRRETGSLIVGPLLIVAGLMLIPLPGPGLVIFFLGATIVIWRLWKLKKAGRLWLIRLPTSARSSGPSPP